MLRKIARLCCQQRHSGGRAGAGEGNNVEKREFIDKNSNLEQGCVERAARLGCNKNKTSSTALTEKHRQRQKQTDRTRHRF